MLFCLLAFSVSAATTDEFGVAEKIDGIDLTGMSTDATSRVVLTDGKGNYYTYPSQYVVTNDGLFTYDFSKINAKGYSYKVESVIRIEIPTTVTSVPGDGNTNPLARYNTIEIYFPENSTITKFSYGCFANSSKLQKINVPKSVTELNTYTFFNSKAITEINFHKDCKITTIPAATFKGCKSLLSLTLPNSVTTIANRALDFEQGQVITELRLGANLVDFGGMHFAWNQYKDKIFKIYAPDTFLANEEKITSPAYDYQGTFTTYPSSMYSVCIFFTGSKAQVEELIKKSEYEKFNNASLVEWDPAKSDDEYGALNTWTVVYNYSKCKAFYNNEHAISEDKLALDFDSYTEKLYEVCACQNGCGMETVVNEYAPIFDGFKYSMREEGTAFCISYSINKASLDLYKKYNLNANISYGVIASKPPMNDEKLLSYDNGELVASNNNAILVDIDFEYSGFDFVISGFKADGSQDKTPIVACAYVTDGTNIYYISASTDTAPTAITLEYVKTNIANEE